MARQENASAAEVAAGKASEPAVRKKEMKRTFAISTLRESCVKLFGCTTSTFDGAFFGCADKEYGIEEAKEIIKKWLGKEMDS